MKNRLVLASLVFLALVTMISPAAARTPALPKLSADPVRVSVSGLSSGGFMAVQYTTVFSASTIGVGVVAGDPYNCAFVNFGVLKRACVAQAAADRGDRRVIRCEVVAGQSAHKVDPSFERALKPDRLPKVKTTERLDL